MSQEDPILEQIQTGFQYLTEEALSIVAALYLWAGRKQQAAIQQSVEAHLPSFLTGKAAIYQTLNQFSSTLTQGFKYCCSKVLFSPT